MRGFFPVDKAQISDPQWKLQNLSTHPACKLWKIYKMAFAPLTACLSTMCPKANRPREDRLGQAE